MFSIIKECLFPILPDHSAYKKVDQYGDGAIAAWVDKHPIETELYSFSPERIENLIKNVLQSLPKDQITWDNLEVVKDHLGKFADQTEYTKNTLFLEISRHSIEQSFKDELEKEILKRTPPG